MTTWLTCSTLAFHKCCHANWAKTMSSWICFYSYYLFVYLFISLLHLKPRRGLEGAVLYIKAEISLVKSHTFGLREPIYNNNVMLRNIVGHSTTLSNNIRRLFQSMFWRWNLKSRMNPLAYQRQIRPWYFKNRVIHKLTKRYLLATRPAKARLIFEEPFVNLS